MSNVRISVSDLYAELDKFLQETVGLSPDADGMLDLASAQDNVDKMASHYTSSDFYLLDARHRQSFVDDQVEYAKAHLPEWVSNGGEEAINEYLTWIRLAEQEHQRVDMLRRHVNVAYGLLASARLRLENR